MDKDAADTIGDSGDSVMNSLITPRWLLRDRADTRRYARGNVNNRR